MPSRVRGTRYYQHLVGEEGLEPSRPCDHTLLKRARIPVPPFAHQMLIMLITSSATCLPPTKASSLV